MTITEIRNRVFAVLDSRHLASPNTRKNALDRVLDYIKTSQYYSNGEVNLPKDKDCFKLDYRIYRENQGKKMSDAASSVINEMYKQYGL